MPKKKKYSFYRCRECEIDFLFAAVKIRYVFCPKCGENLFTEKVTSIWMERPFKYKRPWAPEEDEFLLTSVEQRYSREDIGKALDRTRVAVNRRYSQLKKSKE